MRFSTSRRASSSVLALRASSVDPRSTISVTWASEGLAGSVLSRWNVLANTLRWALMMSSSLGMKFSSFFSSFLPLPLLDSLRLYCCA